jgi:hypothetical protein
VDLVAEDDSGVSKRESEISGKGGRTLGAVECTDGVGTGEPGWVAGAGIGLAALLLSIVALSRDPFPAVSVLAVRTKGESDPNPGMGFVEWPPPNKLEKSPPVFFVVAFLDCVTSSVATIRQPWGTLPSSISSVVRSFFILRLSSHFSN